MRTPRSLRTRLLLTVMTVTVVLTAIATVAFALALAHALSDDADDVARLFTAKELGRVHVVNGRIVAPRLGIAGAQAWVVKDGRIVIGPLTDPAVTRALVPFATSGVDFIDVPGYGLRLHSAPIKDKNGAEVARLVAAISLTSFSGTQRSSVTFWLIAAGVLLVGIFFAARWLIDATLRPVARMTAEAEAWSQSGTLERFARGEPRDELDRLAVTLDDLLDRLAASLRREQLLSLELSHELRTPLARLCAEAETALRRERDPARYRQALQAVLDDGRQMAGIVDTLMVAAQAESSSLRGSSDPGEVLSEVLDNCHDAAEARGLALSVSALPDDLRLGVETELVVRILQPLADNACRYARGSVHFAVRRDGALAAVVIDDDGPGVGADEAERIFEPGVRGRAGGAGGPEAPAGGPSGGGAGLGLALSRRLARAVSGDVVAEASDGGGRFVARLPLAPPR